MDDQVAAVLADAADVSVAALPDGSVDRRYRVLDTTGNAVEKATFGERVAAGEKSFLLDHLGTEAGGMAVNAAEQAHALGADVRLAGHLDHDVFAAPPFDAVSMGAPADVKVYVFADGALMLTDESRDLEQWRFDDLRAALDASVADWLAADAVVCSNWSSVAHMTGVFEDVAATAPDGGWFVVDPGDVTIREPHDVPPFLDALGALESSFDVVLNPNRDEVAFLAGAVGVSGPDAPGLLAALREYAGISAAMLHAKPEAVVAHEDGTVRVPNYDTRNPVRFTGGGDCFTGGLAVALAAGADWPAALQVGNACATSFVSTGETPDRGDLADVSSL